MWVCTGSQMDTALCCMETRGCQSLRPSFLNWARRAQKANVERESLERLVAVSELANQVVGDGVADVFLVLEVLAVEGMGFYEWVGTYQERCNWNLVVRVADKSILETEDCDRVVREPRMLKEAVQKATGGDGFRAFVRTSGTEDVDVVRVYAEAPVGCEALAREIAVEIERAVDDFCGGIEKQL